MMSLPRLPNEDYFDIKPTHYGPWNDEPETLVVRYARCSLKCPICYAAGPSYLHKLMEQRNPVPNTKSVSMVIGITKDFSISSHDIPQHIRNKLCKKRYVRIQGGEPLLNKARSQLTAWLAIEMLKYAKNIGAVIVTVIQTNGIYLGCNSNHAKDFLDAIVGFARYFKIDSDLREGNRYRVAIEISFKSPNESDFAVFSGMGNGYLWRFQVSAYWNLVNQLSSNFSEYAGIAVYPIAGFIMPLKGSGIIPVSVKDPRYPLFHKDTWDKRFEEIVKDFTQRVRKDPRYCNYKVCLINRRDLYSPSRNYVKIRGEELEITGFQSHVPSLYNNPEFSGYFRDHFDKFSRYFRLSPYPPKRYQRVYQRWRRLLKSTVSKSQFRDWQSDLSKYFYGIPSYKYYPYL